MVIPLVLAWGAMSMTHSSVMRSPWRSITVEEAVQRRNLRISPLTSFSIAFRTPEKILNVGPFGSTKSSSASPTRSGCINFVIVVSMQIQRGSLRGLLSRAVDQLRDDLGRLVPVETGDDVL